MERPIRQPAEPSPAQVFYERLAELDTSKSHRPEWRDLSPEKRAEWEAALEDFLPLGAARRADEAAQGDEA